MRVDGLRRADRADGLPAAAAICFVHDLSWGTGAFETRRQAPHGILFGGRGRRSARRTIRCHSCAKHLPVLYGISDIARRLRRADAFVLGARWPVLVLRPEFLAAVR